MIDSILFDLGDTLIHFGLNRAQTEVHFKVAARETYDYLAALGKPLPTYERYFRAHYRKMRNRYLWSQFIRRDFSYADIVSAAARRMNITLTPEEFTELAWRWYLPIVRASTPEPGLHDLLTHLRSLGLRLGIVSNTLVPPHCLDRHLLQENLLHFFPVRVYSSETRYRKPHRRIFQLALEQLQASPDRTLFVGDLPIPDILGARRAGMKTIWKPSAHEDSQPPKLPPSATLTRLAELPNLLPILGWRPQL